MSSLAAIMAQQEAEASREAAVQVEMLRQRTQAQVLQDAELDEDMKLALALSRADMEAVPEEASDQLHGHSEAPVHGPGSHEVDSGACVAFLTRQEPE